LAYLHRNKIIHRDLKPANILVGHDGILKICDFGLARPIRTDADQKYTNKVITLWYRPPELLMGEVQYGPEVDIWSAGCILVEMLDKKPIFPAENETEALDNIFKILGTPDKDTWPQLHDKLVPKIIHRSTLYDKYRHLSDLARRFIESLLVINPRHRISAHEALNDDARLHCSSPHVFLFYLPLVVVVLEESPTCGTQSNP